MREESSAGYADSQVTVLLDRARLKHEWERVKLGWGACALFAAWFIGEWSLGHRSDFGVAILMGVGYLGFSAYYTFSLNRNPRARWRLPALLIVDTTMVGAVLLMTELPASPFFFLYPLIVTGALLRFGEPMLRLSLVASLLSYGVAVGVYRLMDMPDGAFMAPLEVGKLLLLVGLPLHVAGLLRKMEARRKGYQVILSAIEGYVPGGEGLEVSVGDDDEAQALAGHLNALTTRVRQQRDDLVKLAADLERLVEERTAQLSDQVEQTKAAQKGRIQFLNNLSHELRTPLHSIIGFSEILISRGEGETPHMARLVHRNGVALLKRIEDLTDLTQLMSGQMRSDPVPTNVTDLVASAMDALLPTCERKRVILAAAPQQKLGLLRIDGRLAYRLLVELLDNAVKFSPEGGTVSVEVTYADGSLTIVIADEGEGIADDLLPWVFDLFHQGEGELNRRHEGLGIGLSMVKILTDLMGGHASIVNNDGRGARVTVSLPVEPVTAPPR
ncbi:MAG: HAMP domain-containing histidine kinase [Nitrospinae bacterium]|nr:HAMP domain-containing histidine kinase [Nitrospinota bacterium]